MDETILQVFRDSFERCTQHKDFLDAFYLRLLTSAEETASFLEHLDSEQQTLLLKWSLYQILDASADNSNALVSLDRLREEHPMIPGPFWDLWLSTLLGTVAEFDTHYGTEVEAAWRLVTRSGLERLQEAV